MNTYAYMAILVAFLVYILLYNIKFSSSTDHFFNKEDCNALRGFWCIVIILVHVPYSYQNLIQDMIGSFAYIGVSFFFMTSAFGLSLGYKNNKKETHDFWLNRLKKILFPCFFVNIISMFLLIMQGEKISVNNLLVLNSWVQWLLFCYLIFYFSKFFTPKYTKIIMCALISIFSICTYSFSHKLNVTTWHTEIYGFIWGIILFEYFNEFKYIVNKNWSRNLGILYLASIITGLMYIKYKSVFFFGDYILKIFLGLMLLMLLLTANLRLKIGNNINRFLGNISYEVYLLQWAVFNFVVNMVDGIQSGEFILISIFLTIVLAYVPYFASKKII